MAMMATVDSEPGIVWHPRASTQVRRLIAEIGQRSGEFPVALANHLPMVLEAMTRLGASPERLSEYAEHYIAAHAVPFPPPAIAPLDESNWRGYLGHRERETDLRDFFAQRVAELGGSETIARYMPELAAGVAASATHGLMRLAYAVLRRDEAEIGIALGYWAATYLAFPAVPKRVPDITEPAELVLGMVGEPSFANVTVTSTLLWKWIEAMGEIPAFQQRLGRLVPAADVLTKVRSASLVLYAGTMSFEALHAVTGSHWLRLVSPHVVDAPALVVQFWEVVLSLYPKIGMPVLPDAQWLDGQRQLPVPPDSAIAAAAVASNDEHDHSLVFSALEEFRFTGDPLYRVLAARRMGLID